VKRRCQARQCDVVVRVVFCDYHWSLLPADEQDTVAEAYHTNNWNRAIDRARSIIREEENNLI